MTDFIGQERRRFDAHIQIGGELPNATFNGRPWNFRSYQDAVETRLIRLRTSQTGRIVIAALTRDVLIVPRTTMDGDAETRAVGGLAPGFRDTDAPMSSAFNASDGTLRGAHIHPAARSPGVRGTVLEIMLTGTGSGTNTVIEFTPGFHAPYSPHARNTMWMGRSDELLLHELVHSVIAGRGVNDPSPLGAGESRWHNRGEFDAILVTNIYRSETNPAAQLRDSHNATFEAIADPAGFTVANRALIDGFVRRMPGFARQLAGVTTARFNPLRDVLTPPPRPATPATAPRPSRR